MDRTYSLCAIGGQLAPDSPILRQAELIGHICLFATKFQKIGQCSLDSFARRLTRANAVDQVKVYLNPYGHCVGYVVWALLTPDVEEELLSGSTRELAEWEYNAGTSAWILDMAVARGTLLYVLEDLRDEVFGSKDQVTYFRTKQGQRIFKRIKRSSHASFLRRKP